MQLGNKQTTIYRPANPQRRQNKARKCSHGINRLEPGL